MSIFDRKRLTNETFKLDNKRMQHGWYTDKYFVNIASMLQTLAEQKYTYEGLSCGLPKGVPAENIHSGDIEVEMQWFTRHIGETIVVGVDKALTMLKHNTGYWEGEKFINTAEKLQVWAVQDGSKVFSNGDSLSVKPVLRVRGRYRDFAILETPTLGILARASRIATNVYKTLIAANGKPVLFFPARFDLHEVQAADGYAYNIAVQRFNMDYASKLGALVSTDAQGDWWGGAGGGTVAHAAIACMLGDVSEAMLTFADVLPVDLPRIALVDFNNDCVGDSLAVCKAMFERYLEYLKKGDQDKAARYKLYGVRLDTSGSLRDVSVPPLGEPSLDMGVTPRLVFLVRQELDKTWKNWGIPQKWQDEAKQFCQDVKIVVSGGFNVEKITRFEKLDVPADTYGVGSALFDNYGPNVTDYTADVVKVKVKDEWVHMAKIGRQACDNPDLERVW